MEVCCLQLVGGGGGARLGEGDVAASIDTDDSLALAQHLARQQGENAFFQLTFLQS